MSQDVGPVKGPSGAPEPLSGSGKREKPPAGEFKKIMKVEKAREVDPEEKRKRRERAEKEEEPEEEGLAATSKELVTPFALEGEKKVSPLEMQGPGKPSPMQTTPSEPPPGEEESLSAPSSASVQPSSPPAAPQEQSEQITPSSTSQPRAASQNVQGQPPQAESATQKQEEDRLLFPEAPPPAPLDEEKEGFFKEFTRAKEQEALEKEHQLTPETPLAMTPTQDAAFALALEKEAEERLKALEPQNPEAPEGAAVSPLAIPSSGVQPSEVPPPYTFLPPQMLDLFERMVGTMSIMSTTGITETTIDLTAEQFASSIFFGSQIIIKEYATAPREFNIEFNTTAQGASLFQANMADLLAAFQSGNYSFRVNRCETHLLEERPLFKRKENVKDQDKQQE